MTAAAAAAPITAVAPTIAAAPTICAISSKYLQQEQLQQQNFSAMMLEYDLSSDSASITSSRSTSDIPAAAAAAAAAVAGVAASTTASGAASSASNATRRSTSLCSIEELRKKNHVLTLYYSTAEFERGDSVDVSMETDAAMDTSSCASNTLKSRSGVITRMEVDDSTEEPPVDHHLPVLHSRSRADMPKKSKTSPKDKLQEKKLNGLDASSSFHHHQNQLQVHPGALLPSFPTLSLDGSVSHQESRSLSYQHD